MNRPLTLSAAMTATALVLLANLGQKPEAAAALQVEVPGVSCTKKIVSEACSSCSELGVMDNECKSGNEYKACSSTSSQCTNGAQCDQHAGSDPC